MAAESQEWRTVLDPTSGDTYYWNTRSGCTSWDPPSDSLHAPNTNHLSVLADLLWSTAEDTVLATEQKTCPSAKAVAEKASHLHLKPPLPPVTPLLPTNHDQAHNTNQSYAQPRRWLHQDRTCTQPAADRAITHCGQLLPMVPIQTPIPEMIQLDAYSAPSQTEAIVLHQQSKELMSTREQELFVLDLIARNSELEDENRNLLFVADTLVQQLKEDKFAALNSLQELCAFRDQQQQRLSELDTGRTAVSEQLAQAATQQSNVGRELSGLAHEQQLIQTTAERLCERLGNSSAVVLEMFSRQSSPQGPNSPPPEKEMQKFDILESLLQKAELIVTEQLVSLTPRSPVERQEERGIVPSSATGGSVRREETPESTCCTDGAAQGSQKLLPVEGPAARFQMQPASEACMRGDGRAERPVQQQDGATQTEPLLADSNKLQQSELRVEELVEQCERLILARASDEERLKSVQATMLKQQEHITKLEEQLREQVSLSELADDLCSMAERGKQEISQLRLKCAMLEAAKHQEAAEDNSQSLRQRSKNSLDEVKKESCSEIGNSHMHMEDWHSTKIASEREKLRGIKVKLAAEMDCQQTTEVKQGLVVA